MLTFFKKNPYILIYVIATLVAGLIFGWGKLFGNNGGLEWYLDKVNMVIAGVLGFFGLILSMALLYFRYHPDNQSDKT